MSVSSTINKDKFDRIRQAFETGTINNKCDYNNNDNNNINKFNKIRHAFETGTVDNLNKESEEKNIAIKKKKKRKF